MPNIRPISDLRNNSNEISEFCRNTREPVFITKNGVGDMVVLSMEIYEHQQAQLELYAKLAEAEAEIAEIEFEEYLPGEELISALNSQLPEGLRAFSAVMLSNDSKSAASLVYGSVNQAVFPYDEGLNAGLDKVIAEILSQDTILADKRSKAGTKKIDIRPLIFDIVNTSQGGAVSIRFATAAGSEKSLRPEMVCAEIYKRLGLDYSFASVRYTRKGLLIHEQ